MESQLQQRLEDSLHTLATSSGRVEDAAPTALHPLIPQVFSSDQPGKSADATTKDCLKTTLRKIFLDVTQEALRKGQPPFQYISRSSEPVLQRLLSLALYLSSKDLLEAGQILVYLEEVQDVCTIDHCLDIITWLEQHIPLLSSERFSGPFAANQLTRLCNAILKRLGKHEVMSKARLLMLTANINSLFDRSGVGVTGAFASPDPPQDLEVPSGALDSAGRPVDVLLYKVFWGLQGSLQDPISVLGSLDKWSTFKKDLAMVLAELAKSPATVPAARTTMTAATVTTAATAAGDVATAVDGAVEQQAEGAGTQCYLSSYKLFGLQLTDATFRRDFLVQVLVMLHTLLVPGRVPSDTLRPKQRMEAVALEQEVYKVLESTPPSAKEFVRAIKEVLERELTWVAWKKGANAFVVPGKEQESAPAAAAGARKPGASNPNCIDWSKSSQPSLSTAVEQTRKDTAQKAARQKQNAVDGLQLKRELDQVGRRYDNLGEPLEKPEFKRRKMLRLLENGSAITFWAQGKIADHAQQQQPLLQALKVSQQQQYPTLEAVCMQVLREMDPDAGIELDFRRVAEDPMYRWRLGRLVAQKAPETDGLEKAEKIQEAVLTILPDSLTSELKAKLPPPKDADKAGKSSKEGAAPRQSADDASQGHPATATGQQPAVASPADEETAKIAGEADGPIHGHIGASEQQEQADGAAGQQSGAAGDDGAAEANAAAVADAALG